MPSLGKLWRAGLGRRSAGLFEVGALAIGVTVVINVGNIVLRLPRQVAIDLRGIAAYATAKLRNFLVRKLDTASCHHRIARQRDPWHAPAKRLILRPSPCCDTSRTPKTSSQAPVFFKA